MSSAITLDADQARKLRRKLDSAMYRVDAAQRAIMGLGALLKTALPDPTGDGLRVLLDLLADDLDGAEHQLDLVFEGVGGQHTEEGYRLS
ncbi:hypothetical protein [Solidesulfovibrio magneticus]|uniref:Uncharacterized protein n=1 Tax=Solidesulfovibrio magneticus (strain ATCC 700980 / DSM 13731 / RS-1) TaxID=573370 RepID=C4XJ42_SOLM1|nr:hypothetical protein [Solidesulfovibrio magneticus]BAH74206.1 hypothetical protein DMR_07150 [Solidesulfovibrio magneticus RS-1]